MSYQDYIIYLDAGHGGHDPGATGYGYKEKDLALDIIKLLGKRLKELGFTVKYSRTTDEFISLKNRAENSNDNKSTIFISLHLNAFNNPNSKGLEIYYYTNSNQGKKLASDLYDELIRSDLYTIQRGVKPGKFYVLRKTKSPAVLIELGFITNKEDLDLILRRKNDYVEALTKGICNYLRLPYKKPVEEDKYKVRDLDIDIIGKKKTFKSVLIDGENYVPLRDLSEILGFEVTYDNETKSININFREEPVVIDDKKTLLNTNKVNGDTNQAGLRELAEALGADVSWDKANKEVIINTKK